MVERLHKGANIEDADLIYHMTPAFFVFLEVDLDGPSGHIGFEPGTGFIHRGDQDGARATLLAIQGSGAAPTRRQSAVSPGPSLILARIRNRLPARNTNDNPQMTNKWQMTTAN
jgi:hypothetical protein